MGSTLPWVPWALVIAGLVWFALAQAQQDPPNSCIPRERYLRIPGDAYITALLDIHHPDPGRPWRCGTGVNKRAVLELETMLWAIDRINTAGYFGAGKLGLEVYDTCGLKNDAVQFASDKLSFLYDCTTSCTANGTFLGLIGPSNCDAADAVATLMKGRNVTQVLTSECSKQYVTSDVTAYPSLFRTFQRPKTRNEALLALVKDLQWSLVGAVYTKSQESVEQFQEFKEMANKNGICIGHSEPVFPSMNMNSLAQWAAEEYFDLGSATGANMGVVYFGDNEMLVDLFTEIQTRNLNRDLKNLHWILSTDQFSSKELSDIESYGEGAIVVSTKSFSLQQVTEFITKRINEGAVATPENPWLKNLTTSDVVISETMVPSLDAIYLYAKTLKETGASLCSSNSGNICPEVNYNSIRQRFENIRVLYTDLGDMAPNDFVSTGRNISFQYDHHLRSLTNDSQQQLQQNYFLLAQNSPQNPKLIGNFTEEGGFYLDNSELTIRTSSCASICTNCIQQVRRDYDFFVKEGDVYILALMKLHNRAKDPSDKYGCGEYDTVSNPYPQVEALLFALEEMSNKTGINFGAIVYDACDSSVRLTNMLGNFFNNETGDPHFALTVKGKPLDINKVVGCIGAFTSTDTLTAAAFLTHMKRILVSYSASSTLLDDRKRFPYFLRTLPSDSKQAKAILDIIKHLKSNYVHLVHVDNDYGRTGASAFKDLAQENGICITQSTPKILDLDGGNAIGIAGQLLDSNDANIVVFFGEDDHAINFLSGLKQVTRDIMRQFVFIFSEAIADGEAEIRRQFPDLVLGSISLNVDNQHRWHTSFYNYLSKKTPDFSANPMWFNEFWEHNFQCSLDSSFSKDRSLCMGNERIAKASVLTGNPWVPPIITAALALTQGLSELQCLTPLSKCAVEDIVSSVAGTTLQSEQATSFRPFDDNGNGLIGYKIFSFQKNSSGTIYKEVGSISPNGSLVGLEDNVFYAKNGDVIRDFQSTCQGAVKGCDFCVVNDGEKEEGQEGLVTALVLVSVVLAVGLVAVAVFLYTRYKNDNCQVIARSCLVIHRPTSSSFKQNGVLHNETQSQTPIQTTTQDDADIDSIYTTPVSDNFNRLGLFFGLTSSSVDGSTRSADSDVGAANYGPPLPKRNSENGGRGRASTMPSRSISLPPKAMRSSADDSEVESEPAYLQMNRSEPGFPIKRQRPSARDPLSGLATLPRNNRNRHLQRNTPDRDSLEMYRHSESVHYHSSPLIDQSPPVSQQKSRPSDSEPVQYSTLSIPSTNAYTSPPRASAPRPTALYYPSSDRHHTSGESGSSGRLSPILPKPQGNAAVPSHYDPYPYSYVNNAYSPEPAPQGDDGSKSISSVMQYENPTPNLRRHAAGMIPNWLESQTDGLRSKYV